MAIETYHITLTTLAGFMAFFLAASKLVIIQRKVAVALQAAMVELE